MVLTTTYFGPVSWYAQLAHATECVYIEANENFIKQTARNHCHIATANGIQKLTVPVTLSPCGKTPVCDVMVSDHGNWRHQHWEALASAYGMSPFFEYYADDIRPFFENKWQSLLDFNLTITRKMVELLGLKCDIRLTEAYQGVSEPLTLDLVHNTYYQTFRRRHGFLPDMSVLDLLFNEGPEAILYLRNLA